MTTNKSQYADRVIFLRSTADPIEIAVSSFGGESNNFAIVDSTSNYYDAAITGSGSNCVILISAKTMAPPLDEVDDESWVAAREILNDYVRSPDRDGVTAVPQSFRAASLLLGTLQKSNIECPIPFIDGDGDALLLWKKDGHVLALTITPESMSLIVHKDGKLVFASGDCPLQHEIPAELWKHLQIVSRGPQLHLMVENRTKSNRYLTRTTCGGTSFIRACTNSVEAGPLDWKSSGPLSLQKKMVCGESPWYGQNIVPPNSTPTH